jgi:hypothetical protein
MVFALSRSQPNSQSGMATPGAAGQTTGTHTPPPGFVEWSTKMWAKGVRSFQNSTSGSGAQRGYPAPEGRLQSRPPGSMNPGPQPWGGVYQNYTPYYSRGDAAYVPNFGKVTENPIGAGIYAPYRPQASYGGAAQYANGQLWWSSQAIPTSISPQSLTDPQQLAAILSTLQIQGVVRTTG